MKGNCEFYKPKRKITFKTKPRELLVFKTKLKKIIFILFTYIF